MSDDNQPQLLPYPGLRPFSSDEDYLFFGREEQVRELIDTLQQHRFVAVVGSSGSGKSSLVRCGLLSEIQGGMMVDAGSEWEISVMQPGGDPLANLAQSLIDAELYSDDDESLHQIMATINRSNNGLIRAVEQSDIGDDTNLLLVVDQFEEIFRFHEAGKDGDERAPDFIEWLLQAVKQDKVPIYVVLTMRSDFLGDCSRFTGLAEMINDGEYLVPKLNRDQLLQAIEGPAKVAGGSVNRRLTQRLLNDIGDQADQLPVLQHALMRSWNHAIKRADDTGHEMDLEDYEAIGGMANALSTHADEVLAEVQTNHGSLDTELYASRVFKALTEKGDDNRGIRRPTTLSDLEAISTAPRELLEEIVNAFRAPGRTFLMPPEGVELTDDTVIDISHESLMRVWQRLSRWVEDESQSVRIFDRLADTASLWEQDKAGLYRDPDLQIAIGWMETVRPNAAWAHRYDGDFDSALDFLEQSDAAQNAAQREADAARERELQQAQELAEAQELRTVEQAKSIKRFRLLSAVIGVIAVIAVGASIMAYFAMQEAEKNEHRATELLTQNEEQQRLLNVQFRANSLARAEALFLDDDLYGAFDVLMELYERDPEDKELVLLGAKYTSHFNFWRPGFRSDELTIDPVKFYFFRDTIQSGTTVTKGRMAVIVSNGEVVFPATQEFSEKRWRLPSPVTEFAAYENWFMFHTNDGVVHLRGRNDGEKTLQEALSDTEGFPKTISDDSIHFGRNEVILWDGPNCWILDVTDIVSIKHHIKLDDTASVIDVAMSADQQHACVIDSLNQYHVMQLNDEVTQIRALAANSNVMYLNWLPLQQKFISVEDGGLIQLIDLVDPLLDMVIDGGNTNRGKEFVVSPDSTRLAMLTHAGTVNCINLANGDYFFEEQNPASYKFSTIKFDSNGVAIVGLDFENHIIAIDAENGESLVIPSRFSLLTADFGVMGPNRNNGNNNTPNPRVGVTGLVKDSESGSVVFRGWRLVHMKPPAKEFMPDFNKLADKLDSLTDQETNTLFSWSKHNLDGTIKPPRQLVGMQLMNQSSQPYREINSWMTNRNDRFESTIDDHLASRDYFKNLAAEGKPIPLAQLVLCTRAPDETLAASLIMEPDKAAAGNVAARYHQIHFIRSLLERDESTEFSDQLLQNMTKYDNLLEIRSMAYEDQIHEGETIRLDDAEHVGYWDGLANRFNVEEGSISTPDIDGATWAGTPNQYLIWRGGEFADFRISFNYRVTSGNSGLTIRGSQPDSARKVFNANYMHAYLQQGYQPDFVAPNNNFGFSNYAGVLINDNHIGERKLIIAGRGEAVAIGRDEEQISLNRDGFATSDDLAKLLDHGDQLASMTVHSRGPRIDMFLKDKPLNTSFDNFHLRHLSGNVSFQSSNGDTLLNVDSVEITSLGRDIAESEINKRDSELSNKQQICELLFARKQWHALARELDLDSLSDSIALSEWAVDLKHSLDLQTRTSHRALARACMDNDIATIDSIINEIGDSFTLNKLAHSTVGEIGFGNMFSTPVMAAAFIGNNEALQLLIDHGVSVNQKAGHFNWVPAFAPCFSDKPETIRLLLENGTDPNSSNFNRFTLLHESAKWASPEAVTILLEAGANIDNTHSLGWTPLQEVARAGEFTNNTTGVLAEFARYARSERRLEIVELLMKHGAKPDEPYESTKTAIDLAEEAGDTEMVELLKTYRKK